MTANRDALIASLKRDPAVEPPYTFSQLDEDAVHKEILYIYRNARKETKIMYSLGHDSEGDHEENWIIRWLLWHVFRYRDERNSVSGRKRSQSTSPNVVFEEETVSEEASNSAYEPSELAAAVSVPQQISSEAGAGAATSDRGSASRYWDPVREEFRS